MSAIEEAIRMWEIYRQGTIEELQNIPEEQWEHRAGGGARTVRDLAVHIAASTKGFADELLAPDGNFGRLRDPATRAKLEEPFAKPAFGREQSRLSGLWFAAAHEMYQLGFVPAMTQRTQSARMPPRR